MDSLSLWLPWAVHISDGVLRESWVAAGFVGAGLLALLASYRVRDEEIPRIALLSAAFFVATLMHLPMPPTTVHLLLNGLVGVVLGRRAPLAILIGLGLQYALMGHGGYTTLGVNTCVMSLPALLAGWMFACLHRLPWIRQKRPVLLWLAGCVIGMTSVLATLVLAAAALLLGGTETFDRIVVLVFVAHLPIVVVEGVVLGFTVRFLARVKPEMLGMSADAKPAHPVPQRPPALLLVILTTLFVAGPARAHRLDAAFAVLPDRQVRIESWFDLGGIPKGASVQVFRPGRELLADGNLDDKGAFVFHFTAAEPLDVIVSAGAGHRKEFVIPREKLEKATSLPRKTDSEMSPTTIVAEPAWRERFKDALLGISFLLAVSAFLLSWRNSRKLKSL
jgi:cobalt/nickel transport system permease protein